MQVTGQLLLIYARPLLVRSTRTSWKSNPTFKARQRRSRLVADARKAVGELEHRQRIERRPHALLHAERRRHEQELVAIQPSRLFDEVVEDANTHGYERQLMEPHALRQTGRRDVVRPVGTDEGDAPILEKVRDVDVVAREPGGVGPGTKCRATLLPSRVEQGHVPG
jgi:hypothetical protein